MKTLRSYVLGEWYEADNGFVTLVDPSTGLEIARASSDGIDFGEVLRFAHEEGGPRLRAMTFAERGVMLKGLSGALRAGREELLELSRINNGSTPADGSFDIDGASGTLYYYSALASGLADRTVLPEGDGIQLAKTEGFWAQHVLVPRTGAAVHINAFNFPVWGFAEKAACALAAGMPVITKPATATALVAERAVEMLLETGLLPDGALQLICGATGDLLDRLGPQDVLAFTGSAETAARLRDRDNFRRTNTQVNIEADSLNAAVLGPDVGENSATLDLFVRDVVREMTQKAGQKCTAVRRVLVPVDRLEAAEAAFVARLERVTVGDPATEGVRMGPLATRQQLEDAHAGLEALGGQRVFPQETTVPDGGFFIAPTLLRMDDTAEDGEVHRREVFAPVASLIPYDGTASEAARLVALGGGTLVTSVYSDDASWLAELLPAVAPTTGRIYVGSEGSADVAPGSGAALPQALHGGPGRAGGGEELGGLVGMKLYLQRVALQGERSLVENLAGVA